MKNFNLNFFRSKANNEAMNAYTKVKNGIKTNRRPHDANSESLSGIGENH